MPGGPHVLLTLDSKVPFFRIVFYCFSIIDLFVYFVFFVVKIFFKTKNRLLQTEKAVYQ